MQIRKLDDMQIDSAIRLVWDVFIKYEAPDYSRQGVEHFWMCVNDDSFMAQLTFYGAYENDELAGVLATRSSGSHIALFFVDGKHHRKGIGRKLFETALCEDPVDIMTVNSSPYATEIYHRLGFIDTDTEQITNGIRYTPMIYHKPGSS